MSIVQQAQIKYSLRQDYCLCWCRFTVLGLLTGQWTLLPFVKPPFRPVFFIDLPREEPLHIAPGMSKQTSLYCKA